MCMCDLCFVSLCFLDSNRDIIQLGVSIGSYMILHKVALENVVLVHNSAKTFVEAA